MAQIQVIKRRIRSVRNTKQITKAMELVAASKMRRAQEATLRSRPYVSSAKKVLGRLRSFEGLVHPLLHTRPIKSRLLVVITSDRGLAGAYNSNIIRTFLEELAHSKAQGIATQAIIIGQKGAQFVATLDDVEVIGVYPNWPTDPTAADVYPLTLTAIKKFANHEIDTFQVLYTHFVSTIKQTVTLDTLLPIRLTDENGEETNGGVDIHDASFEPSPQRVLDIILPRFIEAQLFQTSLEAIASEHSMRMMAMKNASDNADELIDDLTLTYNGVRQSAITQELAEITAGAQAIR